MRHPSVLIFSPYKGWYMEAHAEYLVRHLSDEFFMEVGDLPYPPYKDFLKRFPETKPYQRNPDDYDLLFVMLATHWGVLDRDKYAHKIAVVNYESGDGRHDDVAVNGCCTPVAEEECKTAGHKYHSLRWGVDTDLFKPYPMVRNDDLLHVGMIGTITNPRRQIQEISPLFDNIEGVKFDFYPSTWINDGDIERSGGMSYLNNVVTSDKKWPGLPNIYNRMDVLLRIDNSYGYSFPVLEAAACGIPFIATYQGIDHLLADKGCGTILYAEDAKPRWPFNHEEELILKVREAIEWMRDNPKERKEMGKKGRTEVLKNWTWDKHIPAWREFFREGVKNAKS